MRTAYVPVACECSNSHFSFMPFRTQWMAGLDLHNRGIMTALLELSWSQKPPCFLPNDTDCLRRMLIARYDNASWDAPIPPLVLWRFRYDVGSGMLYFPPLLHAYRYMVRARRPTDVLQFTIVGGSAENKRHQLTS